MSFDKNVEKFSSAEICAMRSHNNCILTCHEYLAKVTRRSPLKPEHLAHETNVYGA